MFTISAVIFITSRIDRAIRTPAQMRAEQFAEKTANEVIYTAVSDYLSENNVSYSDFAAVLYNNGKVSSIEAITPNINKIQSELTLDIDHKLQESADSFCTIPLGSLSDSYLFAGKGPELKIRICPAGHASVRLKSDFTSAGNNQTSHRISAIIEADMISSIPLYSFRTKVSFEFVIAENIIVGDVPMFSHAAWNCIR